MKVWYKYIPSVLIMLIIFLLSSVPGETVKAIGFSKESYHVNGHFIMFFLLTLAYYKATKKVLRSMLLASIYSVTDELHQLYVPGRAFQYLDLFVDSVGILLAGMSLWWLQPTLPKKLRNWLLN